MKKLVAMLSALTVAGCAIGPDNRRPAVVEAPAYRAETTAADAESLADLPWWEVFQDEALRALIGESLSNNYDLRIAAQRVEESRTRRDRALGILPPDRRRVRRGARDELGARRVGSWARTATTRSCSRREWRGRSTSGAGSGLRPCRH